MVSLRSCLRELYGQGGSFDSEWVMGKYLEWVESPIYLWFEKVGADEKRTFKVRRGVKRGDELYRRIVERRFGRLKRVVNRDCMFSMKDRGIVHSNVLLITLTYDPKRISLSDAWERVGVDYNRWRALVRRQFGEFNVVRVWESHESGYPHIHVVAEFKVKVFRGRRLKKHYHPFGSDFDALISAWSHGFSYVFLGNSTVGAFNYVGKYLTKSVSAKASGKARLGLALMWLFRKRSFSISGAFFKAYANLNKPLRQLKQALLTGGYREVPKWTLVGFWYGFPLNWREGDILDVRDFYAKVAETTHFRFLE